MRTRSTTESQGCLHAHATFLLLQVEVTVRKTKHKVHPCLFLFLVSCWLPSAPSLPLLLLLPLPTPSSLCLPLSSKSSSLPCARSQWHISALREPRERKEGEGEKEREGDDREGEGKGEERRGR
eukprot:757675-Hanusia_phi.AAC.3